LRDNWADGHILATEVTLNLLKLRFPGIESHRLHSIEIAKPFFIPHEWIDSQGHTKLHQSVSILALPASHCSGSVMYLIEGDFGSMLHTGDVRMDEEGFTQLKIQLQAISRWPWKGRIDRMVVDTTFCELPVSAYLPSRQESIQYAIDIIDMHCTSKSLFGPLHVIARAGQLGYEELYVKLATRFNLEICASTDIWQQLITAEPVLCQFGLQPLSSHRKLHVGCSCAISELRNSVHLRQSALGFVKRGMTNLEELRLPTVPNSRAGVYPILYSMHSSTKEIVRLIELFKPHEIIPLVRIRAQCLTQLIHSVNKPIKIQQVASDHRASHLLTRTAEQVDVKSSKTIRKSAFKQFSFTVLNRSRAKRQRRARKLETFE